MSSPNPATTEWVPIWNPQTAGPVGPVGPPGPGDVDGPASAVTNNLAAYADTTGKLIMDSGIPSGMVARRDQANTFLIHQTFQNGFTSNALENYFVAPGYVRVHLRDTSRPATTQTFTLLNYLGEFSINATDDAGLGVTNTLTLTRAGALATAGPITSGTDLTSGSDAVKGAIYSTLPIYPGRHDTGWTKQTSYYLGSDASWGLYSNTGLYLSGGLWVAGTSNLGTLSAGTTTLAGNLSVTGTTTLTGSLYVGNIAAANLYTSPGYVYPGDIAAGGAQQTSYFLAGHSSYGLYTNSSFYVAGNLYPAAIMARGVIYPGNIATGTDQTSWYIASHTTYGLYTNTGIYAASGFYTMGNLYLMAQTGTLSWYLGTNAYGLYTNVSFLSAGHFYPGNQNNYYFSYDANGTYTNVTFQVRDGHVMSGYWMFPGALTSPGTIQATWYLASHSSYGLYTNTGLYIAAGLWVAGNSNLYVLAAQYHQCMSGPTGRTEGVQYYANQDGFMVVKGYWLDGGHIYGLAGASGGEYRGEMGGASGMTGAIAGTMTIPIRTGDYYQAYVAGPATIVSILWFALGSAG